jgi:hypothetical protein
MNILHRQWQPLKLVGGFNPPEIFLSVGMMTFPIYGKIKKCSKPPIRSVKMHYSMDWLKDKS